MKLRTLLFASCLSIVGASCEGDYTQPGDDPVKPVVIPAEASKALGDFAFDFYKTLQTDTEVKENDNIFVSPLSLHMALAMLSNGASGATKSEILTAMKVPNMPQAELNELHKNLMQQLPEADRKVILMLANAIFHKNTFVPKETFLTTTKNFYNAEVKSLPFVPADVEKINKWASDHTNGKVPKVLDEINDHAIMYLLNALYFKGNWRTKFDTKKTVDEAFMSEDGTRKTVKMMNAVDTFSYAEHDNFQALTKSYGNSQFQATFILPRQGKKIADVMQGFTMDTWNTLRTNMRTRKVDFRLPRFTFSYSNILNNTLKKMGMQRAFGAAAEFENLSATGTMVSFVKQDTYVGVDEAGTEAAAVTTIEIVLSSPPPSPVQFTCNRPFGIIISERTSGLILFMGRIINP